MFSFYSGSSQLLWCTDANDYFENIQVSDIYSYINSNNQKTVKMDLKWSPFVSCQSDK